MKKNVESIRSDISVKVCAYSKALDIIANKWTVLAVYAMEGGSLRYGEIRRRIDGISQKMLTRTLRQLERDGLVKRVITPSVPPIVSYSLTPLGETLVDPLQTLKQWANNYLPLIERARGSYDRKAGRLEEDQGESLL